MIDENISRGHTYFKLQTILLIKCLIIQIVHLEQTIWYFEGNTLKIASEVLVSSFIKHFHQTEARYGLII